MAWVAALHARAVFAAPNVGWVVRHSVDRAIVSDVARQEADAARNARASPRDGFIIQI